MAGLQHPTGICSAAYCDVDGTLTDTTIVAPLVHLKCRAMRRPWRWLWLASLAVHGPWWLLLDAMDRAASNRAIYKHYHGVPVDLLMGEAAKFGREYLQSRIFGPARQRLEAFRQGGVKIVFVTGGLDVFLEPLAAEWEADVLAPRMEVVHGICTGRVLPEPFTGQVKARLIREHAARHGFDLAHCHALGDAFGDLPMLECVGHPLAINPDRRLARVAKERGWQVENWR
ncbi:HAD-IB family hydrolase [Fontisphaera persica]|uniref:HAD family hydrolase n=1 Tax=Fontisphaera persica TaxID=2974023 RepID=UPI0024C03EB0|nr:HAD-IB family hydrolase [Fontisphaera persica]WCJ60458.1 HAD-IB family hydrolase [Fontisphaera persica]